MNGTILGNVDLITIGIDVGTELGSLYGYFDYSNDGKHDGYLLVILLKSNHGQVSRSDK